MTATLEHEATDAGARPRAGAPKPSRGARWRVAGRLARRQVQRTWVSSLLIMALIALPIAGMAGAAVYVDSLLGTPEEKVTAELGAMQAWVQPAGVPDSGMWQAPTSPWWVGYGTANAYEVPTGDVPTDPFAALPAGTKTVALSDGQARIDTIAGIATATAWGGAVWDPGFAGRFTLVDGRAPQNDTEVLVSPATLERAGTRIGGTLSLADSGEEYTVTGTLRAAGLAASGLGVAFFDSTRFGSEKWYLPDLALPWSAVQDLNEQGVVAYSRAVLLDPPGTLLPDGNTYNDEQTLQLLGMLALVGALAAGGVAAGYMVVMLAGAAFAVSARRQQRALAIAASVGADARDLRRTVRLQGTALGAVAGVIGIAIGVGVAAVVVPLTDDGSGTMFWGFHVPWAILAGILVFAVLVGTASAMVPARGVARSDTISALRGARRPQKVTASRPLWGSLLILVGVAITVLCGLAAAAIAVADGDAVPYDSPLRWLPTVGIIVGPIIAQLGIILSGRWLLWLASRVLSRVSISARIASRDAVANGARTVPAFAAIGATVFVGVFAVGLGSMAAGQTARAWSYNAPVGTAVGTLYEPGPERFTTESADRAAAAAVATFEDAGVSATAVAYRQNPMWAESASEIPADLVRATALVPERNLADPDDMSAYNYTEPQDPTNNVTVLDADDIPIVMGVQLTAAQRAAYEGGAALVAADTYVTDGTIDVAAWTERQWMFGGAPGNVYRGGDAVEAPQWEHTLDAITVDAPQQPLAVVIAPSTARELGLETYAKIVYGSFPTPPGDDERERLQSLAEGASTDEYAISAWIEDGPPGVGSWLVPLLIAVAVLVLGASAVALGLARFERRPDDATLSAVGGTRLLRRNIGFWQGLVIAGFGTFAGAAAGILPPIGFWMQSQTAYQGPMDLADIPWAMLLGLAVALPVMIAVVNWLVPPRHPDLTRRTAIA